jgi:hypothetical protein
MRARHLRLVGEDLPVIPPGCWPAQDEHAQLGVALLCAVAGIDSAPLTDQHAAYIDSWRRAGRC